LGGWVCVEVGKKGRGGGGGGGGGVGGEVGRGKEFYHICCLMPDWF